MCKQCDNIVNEIKESNKDFCSEWQSKSKLILNNKNENLYVYNKDDEESNYGCHCPNCNLVVCMQCL